eukprot:2716835-Pyramimonas_sp.AAC.1
MKNLTQEERAQFAESDTAEREAILSSGAVRVLSPDEARLARRRHPDRVLSSRMVRRFKPMEGVGAKAKAKSRWCVHGHQDPDGEHLSVYAPTPQTESILVTLQ